MSKTFEHFNSLITIKYIHYINSVYAVQEHKTCVSCILGEQEAWLLLNMLFFC